MSENGETKNGATQVPITKEQLEANIKISSQWIAAVRRGTFQGSDALDIANLIGFLMNSHDSAVKEYEKSVLLHPEWSKPKTEQPVATQ